MATGKKGFRSFLFLCQCCVRRVRDGFKWVNKNIFAFDVRRLCMSMGPIKSFIICGLRLANAFVFNTAAMVVFFFFISFHSLLNSPSHVCRWWLLAWTIAISLRCAQMHLATKKENCALPTYFITSFRRSILHSFYLSHLSRWNVTVCFMLVRQYFVRTLHCIYATKVFNFTINFDM